MLELFDFRASSAARQLLDVIEILRAMAGTRAAVFPRVRL